MTKKLKYTKDILTRMLTINQQENAQRNKKSNQDNYKSKSNGQLN